MVTAAFCAGKTRDPLFQEGGACGGAGGPSWQRRPADVSKFQSGRSKKCHVRVLQDREGRAGGARLPAPPARLATRKLLGVVIAAGGLLRVARMRGPVCAGMGLLLGQLLPATAFLSLTALPSISAQSEAFSRLRVRNPHL